MYLMSSSPMDMLQFLQILPNEVQTIPNLKVKCMMQYNITTRVLSVQVVSRYSTMSPFLNYFSSTKGTRLNVWFDENVKIRF